MSDFKQAVEWMKEGKKVRRPSFKGGAYHYLSKGIQPKVMLCSVDEEIEDEPVTQCLMFIEATDWEIYEPEDNWNIKNALNIGTPGENILKEDIEQIVKLKEKILEDLDKEGLCVTYACMEIIKNIIGKRFGF